MIRLDGVTKRYADGHVAVDDLDLEVVEGELCVLIGPSGCGKTTTMKMINRLIEPTSGRVFLGGDDVTHVDPVALRRRVGYVIQQVGLFPHQTIAENVGTVPKLLGWDKRRIRARTTELLELVGLDPARYAGRYPAELSGGQRQRVGVARALAADPPVLLMDEPFGAIDPITRDRLQGEFLRLQETVRKTIVFVTHDLDEAVRMGDRIAILADGGRLAQYDTPAAILGSPASEFVADFVGSDRGLKRLAVTPIGPDDLEQPPVVAWEGSLVDARSALGDARWGVVVDATGHLRGWVGPDGLVVGGPVVARSGDATLAGRARRLPAWVPAGASLKVAFTTLLAEDAGWVAVLEGSDGSGRYLGVLTPDSLHAALRRSVAQDTITASSGAATSG